MRRFRKIALWVLAAAAGVAVVGWFGLRAYLNSSGARDVAAARLSETLGLPVEVEELSVGMTTTTAALRVPDAGAGEPADLLRIGSVSTDVSLGDLITGRVRPTRLSATGVDVLLRLNADGKVVSPLPKPKGSVGAGPTALPVIALAAARVRIRQTGKPEFTLTGVSGELKPDGDGHIITGRVDDPDWGGWAIAGRLAADPADGHVELSTERGRLSGPLLRTIPYVPPELWDHLTATGETPAKVTFTFKPAADLGYAVELRPDAAAALTVPDAEVTVTQVRGRIRIADGKVTVDDGRVTLAGGTVGVTGVYDFGGPTGVLTTRLAADGVDVRQLPASWGLPKEFEGKLRGTADLRVAVAPDGKVTPAGSGAGEIVGARIAGLDAEVTLKLTSQGGRYRFESPQQPGG